MEIEGRCRKVRDAHFEAARMWDQVYFGLGLAAVLIGVIGGGATGSGVLGQSYPALAALFASISGILAATTAFLKPSEPESPVIPTWAWDRVDRWTYTPTLGAKEGPSTRKGKRRP